MPVPHSALKATAFHEAGHAFADFVLGFKIKKVTIVPDKESKGITSTKVGLRFFHLCDGHLSGSQIGRWHDKIVTILAGEAAQRHFDAKSVRPSTLRGDRSAIGNILSRLHQEPHEATAAYRYLKVRTRNLVAAPINWQIIQDLANTLLEKRALTGDEAVAVVRSSMARKRSQSGK